MNVFLFIPETFSMQIHSLVCSTLKQIWLFGIFFCCMNHLNAQIPIKSCKTFIYIDALKSAMSLELSPDTVTISEGEAFYLRMFLKSCKGAMYFERYSKSSNKIVFSGNYQDAVKLDTVDAWAVDPMTGIRTPRKATHYRPSRAGIWKYYDDKGELLKEEEYRAGQLLMSKK
ncbi:hypothetical protein [Chitinophaga qingshengii]|uniref:Toxin-antitoxin system YwqK family antitoxin n=1 Tax=Chitinophaga qingshengii TaxID=1569794 RepID=A0ABR7TQ80_9BACT|nr:hypothetical protein [Chitinophaga qingshengii]MBC9932645.1 hypothetical protein [Chitinophaga qingshengii]